MSGGEIALTLFATIAFTAPSDAASAIVVLVVRDLSLGNLEREEIGHIGVLQNTITYARILPLKLIYRGTRALPLSPLFFQ